MKNLARFRIPSLQAAARPARLCALIAVSASLVFGHTVSAASLESQVEGLWLYTGLTTSGGDDLPLAGIFLFKDGVFIQQAVFEGEPIEAQGSMAHAGSYTDESEYIHLIAEQTISTAPNGELPLTSRGRTDHDITVSRSGDALTIVFGKGTGTIQKFRRVGPGEGKVYPLADGALAFVDGHFLLVHGTTDETVSGYGSYHRDGQSLALSVTRWTEGDVSSASNQADVVINATFDGEVLTLADGRRIAISH